MHRLLLALAALAALLTAVPVSATGAEAAADDWWNVAWAFRKRVRVNLPTIQPLDFPYRSAAADQQDDVLAAVASVPCESPPKSTAQREVRVVDAGGNVLPCLASGPDARGDLQVVFPARLRIRGQLGAAIAEDTKQVSITVGRNKAVTPGLRFDVLHGVQRVAVLEVTEVAATAATARVVERNAPTIAPSSPVRSGDLTGAEYWVYYGNPDAKEDSPSWQPPEAPVVEYVWRVSGVPTSLTELRSVLTSDPTLIGTTRRSDINSSANPLGAPGEGYLLCAYDTYIRITTPGLYRFSIDTDGPSFLFVNGRFVAIRPGFFIHSRQWEHRGKVRLTAGYHHLLLLAIETQSNGVVTRLGWQPITAKVYSLAPEGLFAKRMDAEVVGFEARDRREQVFFTYTLANASLQAEGGQRYQFVQFHNVSNPGPAVRDQVTWVWKFGDAEETGPHSPGYLFALDEKTTSFPVTLTALVESKAIGKCQRTVPCEPRPPEKLTLSLEVVSFPNIVYEDERMSVAVRLRNGNRSPVPLQAVGVLRTPREGGEAAETILSSRVTIPAEDESFCILPVDLKALPEKRAEVTLDLSLGGQKVLGTAWRIVPSPEELEDLQGDLGGLYDAQGRRIMVCIRIEDPERHLRWVFYRYARDNLYARAAGTRRRVLLFGDRMANLMPGGKPFADYVSLLQETLTKDGRTLDFVARSTGHLPTLPDVVLFAKTVAGLETLPDIVVLSPGLADIEQAVGERDFARSADVMIDRIRAANDRIKIILVSPPPFPGNPRRSELYTKELGRVAKDHHLPFVHLGKLLTAGQDDWAGAYYAAPHAEGVTLQHPNEDAHRLIADAIRKELH